MQKILPSCVAFLENILGNLTCQFHNDKVGMSVIALVESYFAKQGIICWELSGKLQRKMRPFYVIPFLRIRENLPVSVRWPTNE